MLQYLLSFNAAVIESTVASIALPASAFVDPVAFATASIKFTFIHAIPPD